MVSWRKHPHPVGRQPPSIILARVDFLFQWVIDKWHCVRKWCSCSFYLGFYFLTTSLMKHRKEEILTPTLATCILILYYVHYNDVIIGAISSQITSRTIVYSTVSSDADERKHQSSASLAFVRGIHRWPHKWPVTQKMFPFDDVIMYISFVGSELKSTNNYTWKVVLGYSVLFACDFRALINYIPFRTRMQ